MIDQQTIDRIFSAADIVEVVSEFVQLKKSGSNFKGLSPFTNEKTPSFYVSPAKGIYKDFSSGKGGNVVGFLMEHEKLSYPDALKYLARKYKIDIVEKERTEEDIRQENERESLLVVTAYAQKFFYEILHKTDEGRAIGLKYLLERGVREDILEKFQLGYSPEERDAFSKRALNDGYKKEYLVKSGLSVEGTERLFDRFHGRVIFPIHGLSGSVIGFGGRILRTDKTIAKYLNSPESEIYHKGRILYGLYQAKKSIVQDNKCFLVEGYTDVLAMHQAGIENVVASSGTALTVEQIRLVKRFTPNITIIYDGDEAGIRASFRGIDLVLEEGMNVRVLLLPDGEDPDSFARNNSSSMLKEFISENEKDFISFKTNILLKDTENDPVKRAWLISDIVRSISVIPGTIERSVYIRECSSIMKVDERILYSEVNKLRRKELEKRWKREAGTQTITDKPVQPVLPSFTEEIYSEYEERDVIYFLLKFGKNSLRIGEEKDEIKVAEYIIREVQNENLEFSNLVYKRIFEDVLALIENGELPEEKFFVYHEDPKIQELAVDIYTSRYELSKVWRRKDTYIEMPGDNLGDEVPKAILAYKSRIISNAMKLKENQIIEAQKEKNEEGWKGLMAHFMKLKDIQKMIAKELGERVFNV